MNFAALRQKFKQLRPMESPIGGVVCDHVQGSLPRISADEIAGWPGQMGPRRNDHAVAAVAESIRTFGFQVPILCDQNLTIVAGHTRWKAAQKLGMMKVPVIVVEMTDAQRRAFSVADNKTAEVAQWDFPKLRDVLEKLRTEDMDIRSLGFSDEKIRRLLLDDGADEDSVPEVGDTSPVTPLVPGCEKERHNTPFVVSLSNHSSGGKVPLILSNVEGHEQDLMCNMITRIYERKY